MKVLSFSGWYMKISTHVPSLITYTLIIFTLPPRFVLSFSSRIITLDRLSLKRLSSWGAHIFHQRSGGIVIEIDMVSEGVVTRKLIRTSLQ